MPRPRRGRGGGGGVAGGGFSKSLLDDEDGNGDADTNPELKVNEEFARRFTHNKKREDLHRLEDLKKRGLAGSDSDDSESEDEDEDGLLPARTDTQIFETLVRIKKKDPAIYAPEAKFYDDVGEEDEGQEDVDVKVVEKHKKKLYLKDVVARQLLDGDGDDDGEDKPLKRPPRVVTYADEQEELKRSFLCGVADAESEEDDLLQVRHRTREELLKDEEETAEAIQEAEKRKKDQDISKRLEDYFGKEDDLDEQDRFLKNYLLNQGWMDKDRDRIPSYKEVVGEVSEDEAYLEDQDKYEADYNFRFQENAGAQVMANPRVIEGSVRKKNEARKTQRMRKLERIEEESKVRKEELKRLKNLKKKEIVEKLEKIRSVAGSAEGLAALEDDIEEDFNPEEYDLKMQEAFGDEYYNEEDAELADKEDEEEGIIEKPDFDKEDEELGLAQGWDTEEKKSGFAAVRKKQKMSFKEKVVFDKNLEEYYKLDYEDVIGDLPTRFRYRQVKANTYGLDVQDILEADDKDLNQHVSIKKLAPYRAEEWEAPKYSVLSQKARKKQVLLDRSSSARKFSKKKSDDKKQKKKEESVKKEEGVKREEGVKKEEGVKREEHVKREEGVKKEESVEPMKVVERKVPKIKSPVDEMKSTGDVEAIEDQDPEVPKKSKKRRKKKKEGPLSFLPPSRLEAYGAVTKPAKKKRKVTAA